MGFGCSRAWGRLAPVLCGGVTCIRWSSESSHPQVQFACVLHLREPSPTDSRTLADQWRHAREPHRIATWYAGPVTAPLR